MSNFKTLAASTLLVSVLAHAAPLKGPTTTEQLRTLESALQGRPLPGQCATLTGKIEVTEYRGDLEITLNDASRSVYLRVEMQDPAAYPVKHGWRTYESKFSDEILPEGRRALRLETYSLSYTDEGAWPVFSRKVAHLEKQEIRAQFDGAGSVLSLEIRQNDRSLLRCE